MPLLSSWIMLCNFCKSRSHEILLVLVLCAAFLLRFDAFHDTSYHLNGDYNRDYLIAHHIVAYHEFPLTGPGGGFGPTSNSPAYFYLLALPLFVKDDIIFLGLFNVFLQMYSLVMVYLLGRRMFGKGAGLTAAVLFAVNDTIIWQSHFVWQPHIMQPFLLSSFLLLYTGYSRKTYMFLLAAAALFIFSVTLHQPAIALLPAMLFAFFLILYIEQRPLRYYFGIIGTITASLLFLHLPLIFYLGRLSGGISSLWQYPSHFFRLSIVPPIETLFARTAELAIALFAPVVPLVFTDNSLQQIGTAFVSMAVSRSVSFFALSQIFLSITVLIIIIWYFWRPHRTPEQKITSFLLLTFTIQFLLATTLIAPDHFYLRYLTPVFGIFLICLAEFIWGFASRKFEFLILRVIVIALLVFVSSTDLSSRLIRTARRIIADPSEFFTITYTPVASAELIEKEVRAIKTREQRTDIHFFDVRSYNYYRLGYAYAAFWVQLERAFGVPLVKVDDRAFRRFSPIGNPDYIFLDCEGAQDIQRECITPLLSDYPAPRIIKQFSDYPALYIAQYASQN